MNQLVYHFFFTSAVNNLADVQESSAHEIAGKMLIPSASFRPVLLLSRPTDVLLGTFSR